MIVSLVRYSPKKRFLIGLALAAMVMAAQYCLTIVAQGRLTFLLVSAFLPLTSVMFGSGPALILLVTSILFGAYSFAPADSLAVAGSTDQIVLFAYASIGLFLVVVGKQLSNLAVRASVAEKASQDVAQKLLQVEREARQRFDVALDSAGVPFCILTPVMLDGHVAELRWDYLNGAAAQLFEQPSSLIVGRSTLSVHPPGWDAALLLARLAPLTDGVGRQIFDFQAHGKDGDKWFHVVAASLGDAVVAWFADITPRVRAEHVLAEADRRKDEFLATLAHELRNPLAPIRQVASILEQPHLSDERRSWCIAVLHRQSAAMAVLLDDLLDVSRITRGALALRNDCVALKDVMDDAVEVARPTLEGKGHELIITHPARLLHIDADRLRLAQVLANLLTNAAKYTPPGGKIELTANADGPEIMISVADNGIGIDPKSLSAIFSMFSQVDPDNHRQGGLGIGLALSKSLVELHGGRITASSAGKNKGSCFSIHLPVQCKVVTPPVFYREVAVPSFLPLKRRILVVDDNVDAADALTALLELEGDEVRTVYSGEEAIDTLHHFAPDVVLLDLGLPGISGTDVARHMRAVPSTKDLTLIAITGWGQPHDRARTAEAGFDFHFTKPVDAAQLRQAIDSTPASA